MPATATINSSPPSAIGGATATAAQPTSKKRSWRSKATATEGAKRFKLTLQQKKMQTALRAHLPRLCNRISTSAQATGCKGLLLRGGRTRKIQRLVAAFQHTLVESVHVGLGHRVRPARGGPELGSEVWGSRWAVDYFDGTASGGKRGVRYDLLTPALLPRGCAGITAHLEAGDLFL